MTSVIRWLALVFLAVASVGGRAIALDRTPDEAGAAGQTPAAICVTIDVAHDTLTSQERSAALILLGRQFTASGWRVVVDGCSETYTVSHVRLGNLITVHIAGPLGARDGQAVGLEDLPALYSQLVRSLVTGKPVGSLAVIDRTNVTEAQTSIRRVAVDTFGYLRLGYGAISADRVYGAPMFGLGYRAEFDTFGLDISYLNYQISSIGGGYGAPSSGVTAASLMRIAGLHFFNGKTQASSYAGGGLSWGANDVHHSSAGAYASRSGSGLRAELIGGYEFTRATAARTFVQADLVLPFYKLNASSYSYPKTTSVAQNSLYSPSFTVSVGIGWHRERR